MISLRKFRRFFNRKSACLFSVFVILLTSLFSIPVSAASIHDEFVFYQACPVVFNFEIKATNDDSWIDPFSLGFNICPVASIPTDSSTVRSTVMDHASDTDVDLFGDANYLITCTSSGLAVSGEQFLGQASYQLDFTQIRVFEGYSGMTSDYVYQYHYKFNNFWVWSYDFEELSNMRILDDSEVSFAVDDTQQNIISTRVNYDIVVVDSAGEFTYIDNGHVIYLQYDELLPGESFGQLTPEFFINHDSSLSELLDSPDDYFFIYVNSWDTYTAYNPLTTPTIYLDYTFNPFLHNLRFLE